MSKKSNTDKSPLLINETDLSIAWTKVLIHIIDNSGNEISPLIVSITGFDKNGAPTETASIRAALDSLLLAHGHRDIDTVAFTIFPQRLWRLAKGDRAKLFAFYKDAFPRYREMNKSANRRGLYFERLTSFGHGVPCQGNQLEWILSQFNDRLGVRRSMFQASIFDPARDHIADAQLQFPCMQHVSFEPTSKGLVVNAFYATQQLFVKAYGNYLGIAQLGAFMAHEMKMQLIRVNISIGVAKLEGIGKTDPALTALLSSARSCIANNSQLAESVPIQSTAQVAAK